MSNKNKAVTAVKVKNLIKAGRTEINTKEQLEKFPIGSPVSYLNNNNVFRPGGFIIKFKQEYFIYVLADFKTKYRARYNNIQKMWVADTFIRNSKQKNKTNFPVKINNIIVYYAIDNFDVERAQNTNKFLLMKNWFEFFHTTTTTIPT